MTHFSFVERNKRETNIMHLQHAPNYNSCPSI